MGLGHSSVVVVYGVSCSHTHVTNYYDMYFLDAVGLVFGLVWFAPSQSF